MKGCDMKDLVTIDGSQGEGGGQVLRTALSLSAITGTEIELRKIRAGRAKPGLKRQHLTCVKAVAEICGAKVSEVDVGSMELEFKPVKSLTMCDTPFYRLEIAIAREDSDVIVPLLVKQSFFPVKPRKADPIRGHLWLQGYCLDASDRGAT